MSDTQRWTLILDVKHDPSDGTPSPEEVWERIEDDHRVTVAEMHFEDMLTREEQT